MSRRDSLRRWRARSEYHRLGLPDFYLWQRPQRRSTGGAAPILGVLTGVLLSLLLLMR